MIRLTPVQQAILEVVGQYPGRFSRSGLAKMLVGAKSWQDTSFPEYGRFAHLRRKEISSQIEIMCQQKLLRTDSQNRLHPSSPTG